MNHNMNHNNNNIDFIIILMNNDSGKPIFSTKIDTNHNNVNHNKNNTNNSSNSNSKRTNHDDNNIHDNSKASSTSSLLDGDDDNNNNNNDDDDSSHMICSILQTIQNFILYNINNNNNHTHSNHNTNNIIQSIHTNQMILCFMTIQSITFIAISINNHCNSNNHNNNHINTIESFLRIRLEYIYLYLIFHFTDSIFSINNTLLSLSSFNNNNNNDIQKLLVHNCYTLVPWSYSTTTNDNDHNHNNDNTIITLPSLLTGGIPIYTPLLPSIRNSISLLLQQIGNTIPNTFAILLYTSNCNQLISMVQSSYILHQIQNSDLLLLSSILHKYTNNNNNANTNNETVPIWVPICLSRLHSSRYVYVYIHCLQHVVITTTTQQLYICMISTIGTTEQFHLFHTATIQQLIPSLLSSTTSSNVETNTININNTNNDVNTTTTNVDPIVHNNEDDINNDYSNNDEDEYELITHDDTADTINPCQLLIPELVMNATSSASNHLLKYLQSGIIQFVLRVDIPIIKQQQQYRKNNKNNNKDTNESNGHLIQCISSPINNHSMTTTKTIINEHQLWNMYQQLQKRLRIESSGEVELKDDSNNSNSNKKDKTKNTTSSSLLSSSVLQHCTTILFIESIPTTEGVTYITNESITYFAMNGRGFELYYCAETSLSIDHITTLGATLIRQLLADIDTLFISHPLTI